MSDHEHDHGHDHDHEDEEQQFAEDSEHDARRLMALSVVRQYGDPVLRMRAGEVENFDKELAALADRMVRLMHDADGVGLAANQIGILRRLFVFTDDGEDMVIVNPEITKAGDEQETSEEGCLSLGSVRMPVERSLEITIEGRDVAGEPLQLELEGMSARVAQHELDHLDGILLIDRTDAESRRAALSLLRPRLRLS